MNRIKVILLLMLIVGLNKTAPASEYAPPGLYNVEYITLENGFDVVLKKRTHVQNVVLSLVVGVGHRHFECHKRETAHFLEHMLFKGTSKHTEEELERLIEDNGGEWNAYTSSTETEYTISIYNRNLPVAMDTLYEAITDTVITPEKIESTRKITHRENGGKHSWLVRWLYKHGISKSAGKKAGELLLPGTGVFCPGLITPDGITEKDVKEAYKNYYVPSNMTLVVVGNFDRQKLLRQIKRTFGRLSPTTSNGSKVSTPPYPNGVQEVTGILSPFLGSDGGVYIYYRTDGSNSPDTYPLWVLMVYLDRVLFEKIRFANDLSYSPEADLSGERDYGIFMVGADAELDKMETVRALLEEEVEKLRQEPAKEEDIEVAKRRILLAIVQGYESNVEMANYYVNSLHELKTDGKLINRESALVKVTSKDIQRVVNKYLTKERQVIAWSEPTLTYTQFYTGLGILITLALGVGPYIYWRRRRRGTVKEK